MTSCILLSLTKIINHGTTSKDPPEAVNATALLRFVDYTVNTTGIEDSLRGAAIKSKYVYGSDVQARVVGDSGRRFSSVTLLFEGTS